MSFYWQMTEEEIEKVCKPLEKIQIDYAVKIRKFIEKLPNDLHKIAFHEACEPSYQVCIELSRMDREKFARKEE